VRTRVLILAPSGRDAPLVQAELARAGIVGSPCADLGALCAGLRAGAGAVLVADEALVEEHLPELLEWIASQPSWSDLPFLVLLDRRTSRSEGARKVAFLQSAATITLLERPIRANVLISAVRAALRARNRQYEVQASLAALADSEQRYRTLAEALPQLVWTSQPSGEFDYLSRQWLDYTGLPADGQLGLKWIDKVVHPEDREPVRALWGATVTERAPLNHEIRLRRHDGAYRSFQMRGTPIRGSHGQIARWFGTCTDISEIVAAREVSALNRIELEHQVEARTRRLAAANDRLTKEIAERQRVEFALRQAQKLEALGQLTSGVAHDFNNLLMAALGNIDLAGKRVQDAAAARMLRAAIRAIERGAKLTAQLLAFSRKQRLTAKPIDVNQLVRDAGDMLDRTLGKSVIVETALDPGLWPAMADPTQLELVVLNLAINGRDAMKDGGRLTIRTANVPEKDRPLDLPPYDYVAIMVTDTGSGMSEEVRARAFEPFFTTKEVGKGSGLGLSMVHGVAVQSGGNVYIDSELGRGTTVRICLPRAAEQPAASGEAETASTASGTLATILVVDDDDDVREVAVSGLREFGYDVLQAQNGQGALDLLERNGPVDLVLVDLAMPGMNGAEMIRRAREIVPALRVLYVTGYESGSALDAVGSDPLLHKPYRLDTLADAVKSALRGPQPTAEIIPMKSSFQR
jgi:PAS domain S-box-containing protein